MEQKLNPKVTQQLWYLTVKNFKSMIREVSQLI